MKFAMELNYSACYRSIFKLFVFLIFKAYAAGVREARTKPNSLGRNVCLCVSTVKKAQSGT